MAADLYDVRDVSNGGEVRATHLRNIRSGSFDAYQHVELNAGEDGTIENTTVTVRSANEQPYDHDRIATLKAGRVMDTTVYSTNLVKLDAHDVDRATVTSQRVEVTADTIDAGLITAGTVIIDENTAGMGVTVGADSAARTATAESVIVMNGIF